MPAEYLATSRLGNVIQLITLGRQTGILRVVRGSGPSREMGQIQFVDGRPVAALLGHLTGAAVLTVLGNWGESYYAFEEAVLGEDGDLEPQDPAAQAGTYGTWPTGDAGWSGRPSPTPTTSQNLSRGVPSGSWPPYTPPGSAPLPTPPPVPPSRRPFGPNSRPLPGYGGTGSLPGGASGPSGTAPSLPYGSSPGAPVATGSRGPRLPRRTSRVDLNAPLPLDRRERMVLLLIDGRRNVEDLARLTRRTEEEVYAILGSLKMLGLIE